jgi:hypothetical protein
MPTVNIYTDEAVSIDPLIAIVPKIKEQLAQDLTVTEKNLEPNEISVRIITAKGAGMIAPVEVEITAHNFEERALRADTICLALRELLKNGMPLSVKDIRVWIILVELGHSWQN